MEAILEKRSNLVMPTHYVELDSEEMSYVDGGLATSALACMIDVGLILVCGAINAGIKAAGLFGKGALKKTLLKKAPNWVRTLFKCSLAVSVIQGVGGNVSSIIGMFDSMGTWINKALNLCSIGGLIATAFDIGDGCWDGQIRF